MADNINIKIVCSKCKDPKNENEFPVQNDKKWRRGSWCYECKRAAERLRYEKKRLGL